MLKHRSSVSQELFPCDYFFAVYPVSLQFQRQYRTRFHLYFQKNLQIISKHQCPIETVKKDQIIHFTQPQQNSSFRVQSQKNLDYSWSLYIFRADIVGDNEQFIEGQKITLKEQWNLFKSQKKCVLEQKVKFNTIRCKLNYVVIIAKNNQQLYDLSQKYFQQKASVITSDQKVLPATQQNQEEQAKLQELKVQSNPKVSSQPLILQNTQKEEEIKSIQGIEDMKISAIIQHGRHTLQLNFTPETRQAKSIQNLLSPREGQNIKLSNSEIEIGKQIEQIVITKEASLKGQANETPQQEIKILEETEENNIRMTNSQLLNEKKQVIESPYKHRKLIIAMALLAIFILGGSFWALSKNGSKVIQSNSPNKKVKKAKDQPKKVANKKGNNKK